MSAIKVTVPAQPDFVHVVRSVVASAAAIEDFSFEEIEDLRIAVDEACAHLLRYAGARERLTVLITPGDGAMAVVAAADGEPGEWPPPDVRQELAWQVLTALTEDTAFDRTEDGPAIRFRKRRSQNG